MLVILLGVMLAASLPVTAQNQNAAVQSAVQEPGATAPAAQAPVPPQPADPRATASSAWRAAAYSPDTGLFYVSEHNGYSIFYLTDPDPRGSMGLGGRERWVWVPQPTS
jgi:hypothetical protein